MRTPRLIALDMDGTLLNADGTVPDEFWPLLDRAKDLGVAVAPASGRQLASLRTMFDGGPSSPRSYIAENGTVVFHEGAIIDSSVLPRDAVLRALAARPEFAADNDMVLCTPELTYMLRGVGQRTRAELEKYYYSVEEVDDLLEVANTKDIIKVAVFCEAGSEEHIYPALKRAVGDQNVAVSGQHWIDVMAAGAHKGRALEHMAEKLGIAIEDTVAIGDYLNDYELLQAAGTAIAMGNAHPEILAIADVVAPPNSEQGCITMLKELLGA